MESVEDFEVVAPVDACLKIGDRVQTTFRIALRRGLVLGTGRVVGLDHDLRRACHVRGLRSKRTVRLNTAGLRRTAHQEQP